MVSPLTLNPAPVTLTCEIVTLLPPVLVIVAVAVCCVPTVRLPKALLEGLLVNWPAVIPVPDSGIVNVGFDPFEVSVTVPVAAPGDCGAKLTVNVVL